MSEADLVQWRFRSKECAEALREVLRVFENHDDVTYLERRVLNRARVNLAAYDEIEERCHAQA